MRNEILDKASSSRDIVSRVQNEITNAKKKENAKKLKAKLKKMGVEKAPEQYSQQMYNGKWKTVIEINLTDDVPDEIELPEQKGQMYWYETWRDLRIVTKAPKEKKKLTKEELAKKEQDRKSKEVKEVLPEEKILSPELFLEKSRLLRTKTQREKKSGKPLC